MRGDLRTELLSFSFLFNDELRRAAARGAPMEVGLGAGEDWGPYRALVACCTRSLGLLVVTRRLGAVILCGL
jgi:hypothetical protein